MTNERFWELVEMANWPCDYEKMRIRYLKLMSKEEGKQFRYILDKHYGELDVFCCEKDPDNDLGVGDDGYGDLLYHIIGLGKAEYDKCLKSFALIKELAHSGKYKESFKYCIPYDDDYGEKSAYTIKHIEKIAGNSLKEIEFMLKMDNGDTKWLLPIRQDILNIEKLMQTFLKDNNLNILIGAKKWVNDSCNKIDKFFSTNYRELPRKFTEERRDGSCFNGMCTAIFDNTIHDAKLLKEYLSNP